MGKKVQKQRKYSPEFKINVIMDLREHHLSFRETARKYNLVIQSEASAANMIQRWESLALSLIQLYILFGCGILTFLFLWIIIIKSRYQR